MFWDSAQERLERDRTARDVLSRIGAVRNCGCHSMEAHREQRRDLEVRPFNSFTRAVVWKRSSPGKAPNLVVVLASCRALCFGYVAGVWLKLYRDPLSGENAKGLSVSMQKSFLLSRQRNVAKHSITIVFTTVPWTHNEQVS